MSDINEQIAAWRAGGGSGASAKSILAQMTGEGAQTGDYPHDGGDFARCEALLDAVPSFRDRLGQMSSVNAYWRFLVTAWDYIATSDNRTAAIKKIVRSIEKADPGHVQMTEFSSMRVGGPITFQGDEVKTAPAPDAATNVQTENVAGAELRQFIERWERLNAEKKDIADAQKEVMAEAKGRGYSVAAIRKIIAIRARDKDDLDEEEALIEMYAAALGMS